MNTRDIEISLTPITFCRNHIEEVLHRLEQRNSDDAKKLASQEENRLP